VETARFTKQICIASIGPFLLSACSTPTLVEIARRRQATLEDRASSASVKDNVLVKYYVADWDVLNFTDEVKRKLTNRSSFHMGFGYATATTEATLGALAGAAKIFGWGVAAASGLGLGATYVFGLSKIFDSKAHAQAYEQAFTAIQAAEATYYFHQLGMRFDRNTGRVDPGDINGRSNIPSHTNLTPDGETLYYRVSKILKVLNDVLANKIPDLQDLKEAHGEPAGPGSPALSADVSETIRAVKSGQKNFGTTPRPTGSTVSAAISDNAEAILQQFAWPGGIQNDQNVAQFKNWMGENGLKDVDIATLIHAKQYSAERRNAVTSLHLLHTYLRDSAGVALQQFCWPAGVKNDQNIAALQSWISDNGLGSIELVSFIYSADYASERSKAVRYLHLSDTYSQDAGTSVLQQYCWPGGVKNGQNLTALRQWMESNALTGVDPVVFIHSGQYAGQRQSAIAALHLSNSYTRDAWGVKLQNFCWPSGKPNNQNMDKLRQWMNSNGLTEIDFASFIHGAQFISQRRDAVGYLHL
jgi:hypothetical protein